MKKVLVSILIIALVGGGLYYWKSVLATPQVELEEVVEEDLVGETISLSGSFIYQKINLVSRVQGTVSYLRDKGEVKKGELLIKIDSKELKNQEESLKNKIKQQNINLEKAKDRLSSSERDLEASRLNLQTVKDTYNNLLKRKEYLKLFSPWDGIVSEVKYKAGETVTLGLPILTVYKTNSTHVLLYVSEKDVELVKSSTSIEITFALLENKIFTGKLMEVSPVVELDKLGNRVIKVKIGYEYSKELPLNASATVKFKKEGVEKSYSGYLDSEDKITLTSKTGGEVIFIKKAGDRVKNGELLVELKNEDLENQIKQQDTLVKQAEITLQKTQDAIYTLRQDIQILELQLKDLNLQLDTLANQKDNYEIRATSDGELLATNVEVGDSVYIQQPLMIVKKEESYVQAFLSEDDFNKLKVNDMVDVHYQDSKLKGKITEISTLSQMSKEGLNLYPIKVTLEEKVSLPETSTMEISKVLSKKENVLTISQDSVMSKNGDKLVFVFNQKGSKKGTIHLRKIETGLEGEERIEVVSGLKLGERIILKPNSLLKDGIKVKIRED